MLVLGRIAAGIAALVAMQGFTAGAGATVISRVENPGGAIVTSADEADDDVFEVLFADGQLVFEGFSLRAGRGCAAVSQFRVACAAAGVAGLNLQGGAGADMITVGSTNGVPATLDGGAGNDELSAGAGPIPFGGIRPGGPTPVTISGGDGNDTLWGSALADTLDGGPGADEIWAGDGADTLLGGDGDDALVAWGDGAADSLDCGGGSDSHHFDRGLDAVAGCERGPRDQDLTPVEPVVEHRAAVYRDGTSLRKLSVTHLPVPAVVEVTCRGHGCPYRKRRRSLADPPQRLRLQQPFRGARLRAGTRVEITVSSPDFLSKQVRLVMRSTKPPERRTFCVSPSTGRRYICPNVAGEIPVN